MGPSDAGLLGGSAALWVADARRREVAWGRARHRRWLVAERALKHGAATGWERGVQRLKTRMRAAGRAVAMGVASVWIRIR